MEKNKDAMYALHKELTLIPAPSHCEQARAAYVKEWLTSIGAEGVTIDPACNVVFPYHCEGNPISVICAHLDTVFPAETPLEWKEEGDIVSCPGIGDDTASVTVLLFAIKYCLEENPIPNRGILFVLNSCEEGLGNLLGIRRIFEDHRGRVDRMVSIDSGREDSMATRCVGSTRYEVTIRTEGGHSFSAFGHKNAIAKAAELIASIYRLTVPAKEGTKTTYNVGTIEGGTSVNTIAQKVSFLCEYRSDDVECLDLMKEKFERLFAAASAEEGVEVDIRVVGERPCARGLDADAQESLAMLCAEEITAVTGSAVHRHSSSTDCNIPLSQGIPAVTIGGYVGGGAHTTEEWLYKSSLIPGAEIVARVIWKLGE